MANELYYQRIVTAFKAIQDENAVSIMELNAAVSLHKDGEPGYVNIPDHVIKKIQRLVKHTHNLQDIICGKTELLSVEECDKVITKNEEFWKNLNQILNEINK